MNCILDKFWLKRFERNFKRFNHKDSFLNWKTSTWEKNPFRVTEGLNLQDSSEIFLGVERDWVMWCAFCERWVHFFQEWRNGWVAKGIGLLHQHTLWCIMGSNPISSDMKGFSLSTSENLMLHEDPLDLDLHNFSTFFMWNFRGYSSIGRTHALQAWSHRFKSDCFQKMTENNLLH